MSAILDKIRQSTGLEKITGTAGILVGLGVLAVIILALVGWGYTWKFAFKSTDSGNTRCVSLTKTQKNLIKLYLVVTLILGVLGGLASMRGGKDSY